MSFVNFIFENVIYVILFMSLFFMFVKCKENTAKVAFSLILFLYLSAFAVYTYIFAVWKISEKIRAGKNMIRNPMDDIIQIAEN